MSNKNYVGCFSDFKTFFKGTPFNIATYGRSAVKIKCGKNFYAETGQLKNLKKFTVIPHNLYYEGIFLKGLVQKWISCEFFH